MTELVPVDTWKSTIAKIDEIEKPWIKSPWLKILMGVGVIGGIGYALVNSSGKKKPL